MKTHTNGAWPWEQRFYAGFDGRRRTRVVATVTGVTA